MIFRNILFCCILIFSGSLILAQNPDLENMDLSRIKVEELSEGQIRQILERAEESGMTEAQMKAALRTRGMAPSQINKLEERLKEMQSEPSGMDIASRSRQEVLEKKKEDIFGSLLERDMEEDSAEVAGPESRIFGYKLFRNEYLTFEPGMNIPTPPDYQIGPGDQLIVDVWGASQQNYQLPVSPEGTIYIENLGPIQLAGLTMEKASERILGRLKGIYSGLSGPGRNTYAEVTLGNIRSISVHILGEVNLPGTFTLSSFATVFNALHASGGPSLNGSFRDIELFRNNERIATMDVYDFLIHGKQDGNIRLQDQDIIKVNPYKTRVDITGEIKRPGLYELSTGESLDQLIDYTGGFTDKAYKKRLSVYRKTDTERKLIDLKKEEAATFGLQDGDSIPVSKILNRFENRVTINGAVYRPGEYALNNELTIRELIGKAEGLRDDAFLARALIYRTRDDFTLEIIPVNLRTMLENPESSVRLRKDDVVAISSIFDLREEYFIELSGEVNQPGVYPYMENSTLEDLIVMAGGLREAATPSRVEVARRYRFTEDAASFDGRIAEIFYFDIDRNLELTDGGEKFIMEPFDQVFIRKSPGYETSQTIAINGEVLYPGSYSISTKEEKISDLITRAGGLTSEAYPEGAKLIRRLPGNQEERLKALESLMRDSEDSLVFNIDEENEQAIGIDLKKILESPGSKYDLLVQHQDRIEIPVEMQTVRLSGAVLYPVSVRYDKSFSFSSYIARSGGFASDAKRSKSYVIYANGSVDRTNNFLFFNLYPKIEPGAEIVVPQKPPKDKVSTQEVIGISSALTSMALIIVTIINSFGGG
jgi:protein involved in polysaccharide export with SLBB domain